ncbi:MAG: hypothetical protein V9E83_07810 [Baekduia sp.]
MERNRRGADDVGDIVRTLPVVLLGLALFAPAAQAIDVPPSPEPAPATLTPHQVAINGHRGQSISGTVYLPAPAGTGRDASAPAGSTSFVVREPGEHNLNAVTVKVGAVARHPSAEKLAGQPLLGERRGTVTRARAGQGWYRLATLQPSSGNIVNGVTQFVPRLGARWFTPIAPRRYLTLDIEASPTPLGFGGFENTGQTIATILAGVTVDVHIDRD